MILLLWVLIAEGILMSTHNMSHSISKPTKWHVRPAKTQICLDNRLVWSESSLFAWRSLGSLSIHWAHSEDSDQTGQMPRLIWVSAWRTCHFFGFVVQRLIRFYVEISKSIPKLSANTHLICSTVSRATSLSVLPCSTYFLQIKQTLAGRGTIPLSSSCACFFWVFLSLPHHFLLLEPTRGMKRVNNK